MFIIMVNLPDEIVNKIMLYYSTPSADVINHYIKYYDVYAFNSFHGYVEEKYELINYYWRHLQ